MNNPKPPIQATNLQPKHFKSIIKPWVARMLFDLKPITCSLRIPVP